MPRTLAFPSLRLTQLRELQRVLRSRSTPSSLRQRSELVWLLAGGASLAAASEWVGLHYTNAHVWTKRFLESGIAGLGDRPKSGRPRVYGKELDTEVVKAAAARPKDLGLSFTTWSLPKLQEYLNRQPGLNGITRSTIRRRLHQQGVHFYEGQTWGESHYPDTPKKINRKPVSASAAGWSRGRRAPNRSAAGMPRGVRGKQPTRRSDGYPPSN